MPRYLQYDELVAPSEDEFGVIVAIHTDGTVDVDVAVPNDNLGNKIRLTNVTVANDYVPKIGDWVHIGLYDGLPVVDRSVPNAIIDINGQKTVIVNPGQIADGVITTPHLEDGAVDRDKIADDAVDGDKIADGVIDSIHIKNGVIDSAHIKNASIDTAHIKDAAITNAKIANAAIDTAHIKDAAITNAKIANAAIDSAKIQNAAITSAHILDGSITNAKIANAAVDSAKIANASITSAHIQSGAIDAAHIKTGVVSTVHISDGSITDAKIVSLTANKITAGTINTGQVTIEGPNGKLRITSNRLQVFDNQQTPVERVSIGDVNGDGTVYGIRVRGADGTTVLYDHNGVYSEGITNGAITNPKIADGAVDTRVIAANAVTADKIVAGAITTEKLASSAVTADKIAANTITAGSAIIADGAITTAKIADGAITNAKIANATITGAKIANATITDAHISSLSASKITTGTLDASKVNVINLNASNITTGYLSANRISGGTLSGVTINVSTDATIGRTLYVGSPYDNSLKYITFSDNARIVGNYGAYWHGLKIETYDGIVLSCEPGGFNQVACYDGINGIEYFHFSGPWHSSISNQGHPMIRARSRYNYQAAGLKFVGDGSNQYVQVRNYNDNGYVPIQASAFQQSSSKELKENIRDATINALDVIRRSRIRQFNYKTDPDATRVGFIAEEAPCEFKCNDNDDTISLGDVLAIAVKAIQELDARITALESRFSQRDTGQPTPMPTPMPDGGAEGGVNDGDSIERRA